MAGFLGFGFGANFSVLFRSLLLGVAGVPSFFLSILLLVNLVSLALSSVFWKRLAYETHTLEYFSLGFLLPLCETVVLFLALLLFVCTGAINSDAAVPSCKPRRSTYTRVHLYDLNFHCRSMYWAIGRSRGVSGFVVAFLSLLLALPRIFGWLSSLHLTSSQHRMLTSPLNIVSCIFFSVQLFRTSYGVSHGLGLLLVLVSNVVCHFCWRCG